MTMFSPLMQEESGKYHEVSFGTLLVVFSLSSIQKFLKFPAFYCFTCFASVSGWCSLPAKVGERVSTFIQHSERSSSSFNGTTSPSRAHGFPHLAVSRYSALRRGYTPLQLEAGERV
jgi:hypothetical protein